MSEVLEQAIKEDLKIAKRTVEEWLDKVSYQSLNEGSYTPTEFTLNFVNFIKLVNDGKGDSHPTPVVHMKMLDQLVGKKTRLANLCSRGLGKTTLMVEYLILYLAVFGEIPGFGDVEGMIYISDSMDNGVKSARKNIEYRYNNSDFLKTWIPKATFTDGYLEFQNKDGKRLGVRMFGAKTGLRGTKIFGKRPVLAILDDLVSDDDSKSKAAMLAIKDTVYKGVDYALDPTRRKIVFNGTPFTKDDILYEAVESGGWHVNVWPICEKFPCTREEFHGAWEERFSYDFVLEQYELSKATGQVAAFMQELMLRINSEDERVIHPHDIRWYSREQLLMHKGRFNFYMTTDFSTSDKHTADNAVVAVWALNNNNDWFWVEGRRGRQTMDVTIDDMFGLIAKYRPMNVGVEVTGQQGGFIQWLQQEMMRRNIYFTLASSGNSRNPGIRPQAKKMERFNLVVPWFKQGKVFFPDELRTNPVVAAFIEELGLVTLGGFKSKNDDCLDNISMLPLLNAWPPGEEVQLIKDESGMWEMESAPEQDTISSYLV